MPKLKMRRLGYLPHRHSYLIVSWFLSMTCDSMASSLYYDGRTRGVRQPQRRCVPNLGYRTADRPDEDLNLRLMSLLYGFLRLDVLSVDMTILYGRLTK